MHSYYDVCVIGGGSGGIGAAIASARFGLLTLLVETAGWLGGTSTTGGVHNWEPTAGATGIPRELYHRMRAHPLAAAVTSRITPYSHEHPYGYWAPESRWSYSDTLRRSGLQPGTWHAVVFEPEGLDRAARDMLAETHACEVLTGARFINAAVRDGYINSIQLVHEGKRRRIDAGVFVDATDGVVCSAAGVDTMQGTDDRQRFGEPGAPETASGDVNGVSLVYRVRRVGADAVEPLPKDIPHDLCQRPAHVTEYPNGDLNVNVLPVLVGAEFLAMTPDEAMREAHRRIAAHWHWMQTEHGFSHWKRCWTAPMLGVRESRRVVGEYVLRQQDVTAGLSNSEHPDIVAITDHALDVHGKGGGCVELDEPYGVPYRCLIPAGMRNLLIASRAASFSHIAASSCRLSRTIMQLGQAAGTACAVATSEKVDLPDVPVGLLRRRLREQGVQLEWSDAYSRYEPAVNEDFWK